MSEKELLGVIKAANWNIDNILNDSKLVAGDKSTGKLGGITTAMFRISANNEIEFVVRATNKVSVFGSKK